MPEPKPCGTCGKAEFTSFPVLDCHVPICRLDAERWVKQRDDVIKALKNLLHVLHMKDVSRPEERHHEGCACGPCGSRRRAQAVLDTMPRQ